MTVRKTQVLRAGINAVARMMKKTHTLWTEIVHVLKWMNI